MSCYRKKDYEIDATFFSNPGSLALLEDLGPVLGEFLKSFGFGDAATTNLLDRLPSYFVFSLADEWRSNPTYYQAIKETLDSAFPAEKMESEWEHYRQYLQAQIHRPVFSESFSLSQVYVPLRAYYTRKLKATNKASSETEYDVEKVAVDLKSHLLTWVANSNPRDAIRLIKGGPGYGKSSFLKMLAARLAAQGARVLFIPLHRFDLEDKLDQAITDFLRYDKYLTFDPINEGFR